MKKIAVIGGGVSGAASAFFLKREAEARRVSVSIDLLEAESRLGGRIRSEMRDDAVIERGAEALAIRDSGTASLIEELGLTLKRPQSIPFGIRCGEKVTPIDPRVMQPFPKNLGAIWDCASLSLGGKLIASLKPLFRKRRNDVPDITLLEHFTALYGAEAAQKLFGPIFGGIYGGSAKDLSARILKPRRLFGPASSLAFVTVESGMQSMVKEFAEQSGAKIFLNRRVSQLAAASNGWTIDGTFYDAVVLALPAPSAAMLAASPLPDVEEALRAVKFSSAVSVILVLPEIETPRLTGYLIPEGEVVKGISFVSRKWGLLGRGETILRVFVHPQGKFDPESIVAGALAEAEKALGSSLEPRSATLDYWEYALPILSPGGEARAAAVRESLAKHSGVFIPRGTYDGSGIYDCIRGAQEVAGDVANKFFAEQNFSTKEVIDERRISA